MSISWRATLLVSSLDLDSPILMSLQIVAKIPN